MPNRLDTLQGKERICYAPVFTIHLSIDATEVLRK